MMTPPKNLGIDYFNFDFKQLPLKPGRLLISQPSLLDPLFKRTVIYLVEHDENGSMGFVINRQLNINTSDLIGDFPDIPLNISVGGPVSADLISYIHTLGDIIPNSFDLGNGLYMNGDIEAVKGLAQTGRLTRSNFRLFIGYAGWGPGQLEKELEQSSWVVAGFDPFQVVKGTYDSWYFAVQQLGKRFKAWTLYPENPALN